MQGLSGRLNKMGQLTIDGVVHNVSQCYQEVKKGTRRAAERVETHVSLYTTSLLRHLAADENFELL